ncbi:LysR family transcriptional regulator [Alteromonas pelagimontana]|uniref:LysR family transcriptional regulator n=1 Tax=Alteromonas pelagimontana TaxID=1858656 RepID=A0A6M4M974_9ALTE|nr:LysR family transcriptional regulator [Alteromonas pelagimontana]QJR79318.1 LysR family transcriptional regulator [Alteromonas pelagimontana]QJR82676.1 LysR family transcriptional regulator [Alteromonas pelagimontana]
MDIHLAQTFIAVAQSGSLIAAAKALHVSQTTVTARIKNLETQLRCTLLIRNRSGAHLTENGQRLLPYAHQMIQIWEASKRDVPAPSETSEVLTIGCEQSLWNPLLSAWVSVICRSFPDIALRTIVAESDRLNRDIKAGFIDIALVHLPAYATNVCVEHLLDEKLIMVTSRSARTRSARMRSARLPADEYVYVDWGQEFAEQHDAAFPELIQSRIYFNFGPAALQYILKEGGRGYFRTRVVNRHLNSQDLHRVVDTPEFSYPVYILHRKAPTETVILCVEKLRNLAKSESNWF